VLVLLHTDCAPVTTGRRKAMTLVVPGAPLSPSGRSSAIEQARRASADLGHHWVGTEHTLLGLIRAEESRAAQILRNLGFTPDELHETVKTEITKRSAARDK